jgi:hypothetical protein
VTAARRALLEREEARLRARLADALGITPGPGFPAALAGKLRDGSARLTDDTIAWSAVAARLQEKT